MLQLAAPLGLLALGALLAPILIHLVRRPLRVVRVGSLRFLRSESRQVHSLRWHEWLLLILRCMLLAALAGSLAGLRWEPRAPAPARWLLLTPGATFDATDRAERDRLRGEGFESRVFSAGFPAATADDPAASAGPDAWSLLRELDLRLPAGSRVVVFGPTWATQFQGTRPTLANVEVSWRETDGTPPTPTAARPTRVGLVAAPDRAEDARYLRAAFTAIGATIVTDDSPEWIFQLGDALLPRAWVERVTRGARLVTDAPNTAAPVGVTRWLDVGASRVHLRQRIALNIGTPLERDSAGAPWLTEERRGAGVHWRFAFRFHPDWSDWPLGSAFPEWWRAQMNPASNPTLAVGPEQATPIYVPAKSPGAPQLAGYGRIDLRGWCWLLALFLFAIERILSLSTPRRKESE
ncbi:MAG: hypothetical protein EXS37_15195 [Opitutus sp.]|nr:hypothetical protein [Opitutus sp.]